MKCVNCINARTIISENGRHPLCSLTEKEAMECLMNKKDKQIKLPTRENKNPHEK